MRLSMCCVILRARCRLVPRRIRRPPHRPLLPASSLFAPLPPSPVSQLRLLQTPAHNSCGIISPCPSTARVVLAGSNDSQGVRERVGGGGWHTLQHCHRCLLSSAGDATRGGSGSERASGRSPARRGKGASAGGGGWWLGARGGTGGCGKQQGRAAAGGGSRCSGCGAGGGQGVARARAAGGVLHETSSSHAGCARMQEPCGIPKIIVVPAI